jgi:hypothetical protein
MGHQNSGADSQDRCCRGRSLSNHAFETGARSPDSRFEVDFLGRNVYNKHYTTSVTVSSTDGSIGYDGIGEPSWFGAEFHVKL